MELFFLTYLMCGIISVMVLETIVALINTEPVHNDFWDFLVTIIAWPLWIIEMVRRML